MTRPIDRSLTSPSGTSVRLDGDAVTIQREARRPGTANVGAELRRLDDAVNRGDFKAATTAAEALGKRLETDGASLSDEHKREVAKTLQHAADAADKGEHWSFLRVLLSILLLGLPLLLHALHDSDAKKLEQTVRDIQSKVGANAGVFGSRADGDVSGNMNLYVRNPLLGATQRLADGLGGDFVRMSDAVATNHYTQSSQVDTGDFERTSGVVLIDRGSRAMVSQDPDGGFYTLSAQGSPVFKGADGGLYFEPRPGEVAVPVPQGAEVQRTAVDARQVAARARLPNDPPARPDMQYAWHGYNPGEKVDVGWWGQCESSGLLGSVGFMPARAGVTLYDETRGGRVDLSAQDVTNMMVFMARGSFFGIAPARNAGDINRSEVSIDDDKPHAFHEFVQAQIAAGLPFNLEAHSYEQIWNYPIHAASIEPKGSRRDLGDGGWAQSYVMKVTTSGGSTKRYTYEIQYGSDGAARDSKWDLAACEAANGKKNAVPDKMKSYLAPGADQVSLSADSANARDEGWTPEATRVVADLYFASQAQADADGRVYAVRTADGRLEQMSRPELDAYVRARQGTGTDR